MAKRRQSQNSQNSQESLTISDICLSQQEKEVIDMVYSDVERIAAYTATSFVETYRKVFKCSEDELIQKYDGFKRTFTNSATTRILNILGKISDENERLIYLQKLNGISINYDKEQL